MAVRIFPKARQGQGAFNGGEIIENKPIGFPQDGSEIRPYSNLFYWAHATAVTDSTIGLHPHQGFEICSFILSGPVRHYDTKLKEWRALDSGDVQIIRAGSGISHSEWMGEGAEMFQIWFDPDLARTLPLPASYDDYRADNFPVQTPVPGVRLTTLAGESSPFRMDTPGIRVYRLGLDQSSHSISLAPGEMASLYLIRGSATLQGERLQSSDFALVNEEAALRIETEESADLFVLISPAQPGYRTYAQLRKIHAE
ncbi:MAG: pirin family protein [Saprospiraceae bacterium]|nr:pirin family protein [Saprospiraceae bacterium]